MSISRAFTMRRNRGASNSEAAPMPMPSRSLTMKHSFASGTVRNKISAPIELISTTNMLSYNAPDIFPKTSPASTTSRSSNSDDESDRSVSSASSPTTDISSVGSASPSPSSPEPNHLSCYFGQQKDFTLEDAPVIPRRAPSHTKKNSEILARKRSLSSPKNSISMVRSSVNMFSAGVDAPDAPVVHPFGNELAKVTELAEDYGISQKMSVIDEEEQELASKGLFKFRAEDYMSEIQGLFMSAFGETKPIAAAMWI